MKHNAVLDQVTCFSVGHRPIGVGHPTLVIAEIGVNHDGSVRLAKELVELAAACGADAVKLQLFTAKNLMHSSSQFAGYQQERVADASPAAMLQRYELSPGHVAELVELIRKRGLLPIATPFSPADVDVVRELALPAVKIASPDLVNRPLLSAVTDIGVPVIVSTGAATMDEVATTVDWFEKWQRSFALLHCVSSYPTPAAQAHLCWIRELAEQFNVPVGLSDHTTDELAGAMAVAGGACIVEKHFTYDRGAKGPDHSASADPEQFTQYVKMIRRAEMLRGTAGKRVLDIELDVRQVSRQSLVLLRDLQPGEVLSESDITVQRPGTGIPAADVMQVVGRTAARAVARGDMLHWEMLSSAAA